MALAYNDRGASLFSLDSSHHVYDGIILIS